MFNIGTQELLIILLVVLILFGAKRIPEVARALGKGVGDFRDALAGVERELKGEPRVAGPRRIPGEEATRRPPPGVDREISDSGSEAAPERHGQTVQPEQEGAAPPGADQDARPSGEDLAG